MGNAMRESILVAFLMAVVIFESALVGALYFGTAKASTDVTGIIDSNTTWTKTNSPYTLTGPVKVNNDVTLTIEAGATVNLNSYYIQVEGTLQAKGSNADPIQFSSGRITFTEKSKGWNEQTSSGCIIENAILNSVEISSKKAIKFNHNTINGDVTVYGASIVSKNVITGGVSSGGIDTTSEKYPVISSNIISWGSRDGKYGIITGGYALIVNNTISNCNYGIRIITGRTQLGGSIAPNAIVERNKITGTNYGIHVEIYPAMVYGSIKPSISNNTVTKNTIGIYLDGDARYLTIKNNNIQDNSDYSIYLSSAHDLNAGHNWWGTTGALSIKQKIFDFDRDFNLGKVIYTPFLTEPNPEAEPDPNALPPTPTPTSSPTPTPDQEPALTPEQERIIGAVITAAVIVAFLGLIIYLIKRK